jgi:Mg-chelatase subunit ChlD
MADQNRRTTSRQELARNDRFEEVSPDVGVLDEEALDKALGEDPDETLALLAELVGATDPKLRELARRLAGRIVVDLARRGPSRTGGTGKLQMQPLPETGGDIDVDASLDGLVEAKAAGRPPSLDELRAPAWVRPDTALCLLVDRSGSMTGAKLASAAVAAAAVANRAPADHSILAFSSNVLVVKSQDYPRPATELVDMLLRLRGHGTTDLTTALRAAGEQLARSRALRKICVLLSDCRSTVPGDVEAMARSLDELVIVAPADDAEEATALAGSIGAKLALLDGPMSIPDAFAHVLV